jgi:hypothetical protein
MAKFKPLPNGSVHTMETITERCEEEGECLIWQAGKSHGTPALRHDGRIMQVRRYIFEVLQGKTVPKGMLISFTCDNIDCVHPEHIRMFTRKQLQARTTKRTQYGANPARSLRLAKAAQARSSITWDQVREIRAMDGTARGIARELGLAFSSVNCIRNHRTWKENSPFAGLLTS